LLLKAKWLVLHHNKLRSLFVSEVATTVTGQPRKRLKIKKTRSNNPFTHSLDWLAKKLMEQKHLDVTVWKNLEALMELRDCCVHFYNGGRAFSKRLQEVGSACLKNYVTICHEWFKRDLQEYNFYLMPLSFVTLPETEAVILNPAERKFLAYVDSLESADESQGKYSVAVNIEVRFTKSKAKDALAVIIDNSDPNATVVRLTEEQLRERWKWDYAALTKACRERYSDFVENNWYNKIRKALSFQSSIREYPATRPWKSSQREEAFF